MKLRKVSIALIVVLSICFLFAATASAAWYTCTVNYAGGTPGGIRINLTDDGAGAAFSNMWFSATTDRENETLATALSAMSIGKKVLVQINTIGHFEDLLGIYLTNN